MVRRGSGWEKWDVEVVYTADQESKEDSKTSGKDGYADVKGG